MPRIETFEKDNTITGNDKLLGTDVSGATKNYLVSDLSTFINKQQYVHHQNNA